MSLVVAKLLQYIPTFVFTSFISIYFADQVLKYPLRSRKKLYIINISTGFILGLLSAIVAILKLKPNGFMGYEDPEVIGTDLLYMIESWEYLITYIILIVGMSGRLWKKIAVSLLSGTMLVAFSNIFELVHGTIASISNREDTVGFYLIFYGVLYLSMLIRFFIFRYITRLRSKYDNVPLPLPVLFVSATTFGLFMSVAGNTLLNESKTTRMRVIAIIFLMMTLAGSLIFFYIRATRKESLRLRDRNKANEDLIVAQTQYFEASAQADTKIRAMRHDMKNNIQVLSLLLENKEYDKMREYLEELGEGLSSTDVSAHTGNTIADAIIADKTSKASGKGITIRTSGKIKGVDISSVDMCKILSNILDNAIEAASAPGLKELPDDLRTVTLDFRSTGNFFMISANNPCEACPVIINGKIETTKENKTEHGFGLMNIESAAAVYGGEVSVSCDPESYGGSFTIEVMLPVTHQTEALHLPR